MTMNDEKEKLAQTRHAWYVANKQHHHELVYSWKIKNRDKHLQISRSGYKKNAEKRREKARIARWKNPEANKIAIAKWSGKNPAKIRELNARKYAARLKAKVQWANPKMIQSIYELADKRCKESGQRWEVDHIVPLISDRVCGLHVEHNLQLMLKEENIRKHNRYWPEMS